MDGTYERYRRFFIKVKKRGNISFMVKSGLRKYLIRKRKNIPEEKRRIHSESIAKKILSLPEIKNAKVIAAYCSSGFEVKTEFLIAELLKVGKIVVVPSEEEERGMHFVQIDERTIYRRSPNGYSVPVREIPYAGVIDIYIVPCVGFDGFGNRLGYGGGWYDRVLRKFPNAISLGVAFAEQKCLYVPMEKHDVRMRIICSMKGDLPLLKRYAIFGKEERVKRDEPYEI